ncbi:MAG: Stf0 sulfotransferase family protein [Silicimonas sp.]|jgi:LPS sulfotransferase NodH|nr:Stf0 sulfotransferase family protein [Silicimonas sp.]
MRLGELRRRLIPKRLAGESALGPNSCHLNGLRQVFDPVRVADGARADRDLVLLAFTNRSGSTHLGQLLASAPDLYGFREDLNHTTVCRRAGAEGLTDLTAYVAHITAIGATSGAGFGLKASAEQLRLVRLAGIDGMFNRTTVIRIRRRDRIAQAVSLWMARETREWSSRQTPSGAPLTYDHRTLRRHLDSVQSAESALDLVLSILPYQVLNVDYDELCSAPENVVATLRAGLGLPPSKAPLSSWVKRQSSPEKSAFVARFREELCQSWSLPDGPPARAAHKTRVMKTELGSSA